MQALKKMASHGIHRGGEIEVVGFAEGSGDFSHTERTAIPSFSANRNMGDAFVAQTFQQFVPGAFRQQRGQRHPRAVFGGQVEWIQIAQSSQGVFALQGEQSEAFQL